MKRLSFLAALFGGGAAKAQLRTPAPGLGCEVNERYTWDKETQSLKCAKAYRNNECPVCGTMAESYKPPRPNPGVVCVDHSGKIVPCFNELSQITRCRTCNAAFWHDAEVKP